MPTDPADVADDSPRRCLRCVRCGQPIAAERLVALAHAIECIACARLHRGASRGQTCR